MIALTWTAGASAELRRIRRHYRLSDAKAQQLCRIAEDWATRRIAENDAHGYDDEPRAVIDSDVGYSWAYMMMCEPAREA